MDMASYQGHLMFSSVLGAAYGGVGLVRLNLDWGPVLLGAGVTTIGGLLPDLDSDSGVPVREMFGLAAAIVPLLCYPRLRLDFTPDQTLVLLGGIYLFIRYFLSSIFKKYTVHRGMFHSVPALLISGLALFQIYHNDTEQIRWYIAGGVMLGFLSHLVLDELYSVDFMGIRIKLNKYAGSAIKFWSPSLPATLVCYAILGVLAWSVWRQYAP
jgi:LexA-binding, inner membrane-associated putative hydrolase